MDIVEYLKSLGFPIWVIITSVILAYIGAFAEIVKIVAYIIRRPTLYVKITNEIFFRLSGIFGETLFSNILIISEYGAVQINDITFTLQKIDKPLKTFALKCLRFGKKIKGADNSSDHYFYTTSAVEYISPNKVKRLTIMSTIKEYDTSIKEKYSHFRSQASEYKESLINKIPQLEQDESKYLEEIYSTVVGYKDKLIPDLVGLIQLESGAYELSVEVKYHEISRIRVPWNRKSTSKLCFKINEDIKDTYTRILADLITTEAYNIILNRNNSVTYPEYTPSDPQEID